MYNYAGTLVNTSSRTTFFVSYAGTIINLILEQRLYYVDAGTLMHIYSRTTCSVRYPGTITYLTLEQPLRWNTYSGTAMTLEQPRLLWNNHHQNSGTLDALEQ